MKTLRNNWLIPGILLTLAAACWWAVGFFWLQNNGWPGPADSSKGRVFYFLARVFGVSGLLAAIYVGSKYKVRNVLVALGVLAVGILVFQVHEHNIQAQSRKECIASVQSIPISNRFTTAERQQEIATCR